MNSLIESIIYYSVRVFGFFVRLLPLNVALFVGRLMGLIAYYIDIKHKSLVYSNLKIAFAKTKSSREIRKISKKLFQNYGQNIIELLRLPLMTTEKFKKYVHMEGQEHVLKALEGGKGVILLAMHFGSWELASLAIAMLDRPYKVIVKPQKRYTKLDNLLNSYRECGGSVVIERGFGTREFIKSLKNNDIVGMVVDQGGKDGALVPFFDRQASMSVGAIRMGLKMGVPVCFAIIIRQKGAHHRLILHKPFELKSTGNLEKDLKTNLKDVTVVMEQYIRDYPTEYMWFYKIWKYSKESTAVILNDGKTGHLRQSQTVAHLLEKALAERNITTTIKILSVAYKSKLAARIMSVLSVFANHYIYQGRLGFMRWFLTKESFDQIMSLKADFVISCGSSTAAVNYLLANDQQAKSIAILKPGLLGISRFDLVVLPYHDKPSGSHDNGRVVVTRGATNLVSPEYLAKQSSLLLNRYSHLKLRDKFKIGLLIGGDTKNFVLTEQYVKIVVNQIKEIARELKADILISTSRRTAMKVENMLVRELKKNPLCQLLVIPSRNDVPEAVGGILGLCDIVVVSGDSISMISEAASSGKKTIVFPAQLRRRFLAGRLKHNIFIDQLNEQGYILSSSVKNIKQSISNIARNKIQTKKLDDNQRILESLRKTI